MKTNKQTNFFPRLTQTRRKREREREQSCCCFFLNRNFTSPTKATEKENKDRVKHIEI